MAVKRLLAKLSPARLGFILVFAVIMTYFVIRAFAASGTATLYTSPGGSQTVTTGQSFTVNVRVSTPGGVPVTGASVYLSYPTSKLQITGESYSGSAYNTQLLVSDSGGVLRMDRAAFPAISGGDQLFAQVSFKAIATGSAPLSFTGNSIATSGEDDSNILTQKNGVTYNIGAPAAPSSGSSSSGSTSGSSPGTSSGGSATSGSHGSSTTSGGTKATPGAPATPGSPATSGDNSASGGSSGNSTTGSTTDDSAGLIATPASTLQITVLDSHSKPVAGAEVVINGQVVKTDRNGVARFNGVPAGKQAVTIKYNGKKTSRTLAIKNNGTTRSPQFFKVSITRNKFNPALLVVPVAIVAMVGIFLFRPWDKKFAPVLAKDQTPPIVSSNHPAATTPEPPAGRKLETPGTVYSPTDKDQPPKS